MAAWLVFVENGISLIAKGATQSTGWMLLGRCRSTSGFPSILIRSPDGFGRLYGEGSSPGSLGNYILYIDDRLGMESSIDIRV